MRRAPGNSRRHRPNCSISWRSLEHIPAIDRQTGTRHVTSRRANQIGNERRDLLRFADPPKWNEVAQARNHRSRQIGFDRSRLDVVDRDTPGREVESDALDHGRDGGLGHGVDGIRLHPAVGDQEIADRDVLTPLLNRRAFVRELGRAIAFAQRYGAKASLAYFDLDGFKAVNDRFGHAGGDEALKAVSKALIAHVRETDVVGRIGGDEFGVILAQADGAAAAAKAAQLAAVIQSEPVQSGEWMMPLHISWGVREIDPALTAEDMQRLVEDGKANAGDARKRARA